MSDSLAAVPTLTTARLTLAPLRAEHAAALSAITDDPAIAAAIHFLTLPFTPADAERLIAGRGDQSDCFIGAWQGDELIGVVGAHLVGADRIEIGYWIARRHHGQGYVSEAAAAVVAWLRSAFPARTIFAECRPDNRASWRILEKLGFRTTGTAGARPGRRVLELPPVPQVSTPPLSRK